MSSPQSPTTWQPSAAMTSSCLRRRSASHPLILGTVTLSHFVTDAFTASGRLTADGR